MAYGHEIKIRLNTVSDLAALHETNMELAKLAADAGRGNASLRQSTMLAAREYYSIGDAADKAAGKAVLSAKQIEAAWQKAMAKPTEEAAKGFGNLRQVAKGAADGIGGAFAQVANMFLQGGIWGAAAAAVVKAFTFAWDKIKERAELAAKRIERAFQDSVTALKSGAEQIDSEFSKSMSAIDKTVSRFDAATNSVKELTKAQIELARQTAIANGMSKDDADRAASDLGAEVDYEAERSRLENVIALEKKRVEAANKAEAETAAKVKEASRMKAEAEAELNRKREEYVRKNAKTTMLSAGPGVAGVQLVRMSDKGIAEERERASAEFDESDEGRKAAERVKKLEAVLASIKTDKKAAAAAADATAKIESAETALDTLETRREARELEAQNEIAAEAAKEASEKETADKKEAAERTRLAEKEASERKRLAKEAADEQARLDRELAQKRLEDLRAELSERQRAQGEAQGRQSKAEGSLSRAWGWYRNQDSMQSAIDEFKAQAEAEKRWKDDFEKLKSYRRDWREAEFGSLSAHDESVRQVALAKEEKAAADRAVIETAENTRQLADKLDELLQVKG